MTSWLRLFRVLLTARRRGPLGPLGESSVSFRVMPGDLDINLHMNNGRYLQVMDLGRFDFIIRVGLLPALRRRRWMPLVGSETIRFRRSLAPFGAFRLHTRLLCWDDKWFYFEQRFTARGELVAAGIVKGLLRGPGGNVPPADVLEASGHTAASPPPPPGIEGWTEADAALFETAMARDVIPESAADKER